MTSNAEGTPPALMHNFQHNRVVHAQIILLTVKIEDVSQVDDDQRVTVSELPEGFVRLVARYGFMENPDIPELLRRPDTPSPVMDYTTFFLGRETLLSAKERGLSPWREGLFSFMSRNAMRATTFFNVPPERVMEVGLQIEL